MSSDLMMELKEFAELGCSACEACKNYDIDDCPHLGVVREAILLLERQGKLLNERSVNICKVRRNYQAAEMKICSMCGHFLPGETDNQKGTVVIATSGNGEIVTGTMTCGELNGWPCCGKFTPWISVSDRLPDKEWLEFGEETGRILEVIVMIQDAQQPTTLFYDGHDGFFNYGFDEEKIYYAVTHWMPLPEGPR